MRRIIITLFFIVCIGLISAGVFLYQKQTNKEKYTSEITSEDTTIHSLTVDTFLAIDKKSNIIELYRNSDVIETVKLDADIIASEVADKTLFLLLKQSNEYSFTSFDSSNKFAQKSSLPLSLSPLLLLFSPGNEVQLSLAGESLLINHSIRIPLNADVQSHIQKIIDAFSSNQDISSYTIEQNYINHNLCYEDTMTQDLTHITLTDCQGKTIHELSLPTFINKSTLEPETKIPQTQFIEEPSFKKILYLDDSLLVASYSYFNDTILTTYSVKGDFIKTQNTPTGFLGIHNKKIISLKDKIIYLDTM